LPDQSGKYTELEELSTDGTAETSFWVVKAHCFTRPLTFAVLSVDSKEFQWVLWTSNPEDGHEVTPCAQAGVTAHVDAAKRAEIEKDRNIRILRFVWV
jgi:hypothetical protein